ncbi:hypothetical protein H072_8627 [Dactylellina haptotyla CBS 200.50]|uniref:Uncharacterized protein n=1 Tax=Dactylellina haptotyla (strain CBS 200.50) TaxID=1284197 RepID=S8A3R9_DACHA|nr:hypothetical protein H072_8627 [Dactylellina haptotyla CBS 200.50]
MKFLDELDNLEADLKKNYQECDTQYTALIAHLKELMEFTEFVEPIKTEISSEILAFCGSTKHPNSGKWAKSLDFVVYKITHLERGMKSLSDKIKAQSSENEGVLSRSKVAHVVVERIYSTSTEEEIESLKVLFAQQVTFWEESIKKRIGDIDTLERRLTNEISEKRGEIEELRDWLSGKV